MAIYAWQTRQPPTTSDFTIFYDSAKRAPSEMYVRPIGPPRGNMNAPQFQLLIKPLTRLPLDAASDVWRGLNLIALCGCVWWMARKGPEKWSAADYGAALAWAPFQHALTLNQVTWILWPLLVWTWWCWRRDRWAAGAIGLGLALSLKIFLGVFLLWLVLKRQWRAFAVSVVTAAASFGVGVAIYGTDVVRAWIAAIAGAEWPGAFSNASIRGLIDRSLTRNFTGAPPLVDVPRFARLLYLVSAVAIVVVTLVRTRDRDVDRSWPALMASALLASPLGWVYYLWWMLPGTRPSRVLLLSPLLWVPFAYVTIGQPAGWATATIGSVYGWGLLLAWTRSPGDRVVGVGPIHAREIVQGDAGAPAVR
jgi:alpha-1,2-mannosyltransferase